MAPLPALTAEQLHCVQLARSTTGGFKDEKTGFKDENTGLLLTQVSAEQDKVLPITRALGLV